MYHKECEDAKCEYCIKIDGDYYCEDCNCWLHLVGWCGIAAGEWDIPEDIDKQPEI